MRERSLRARSAKQFHQGDPSFARNDRRTGDCHASAGESQEYKIVDCDVDAPDLHLLLHPSVKERQLFTGARFAVKDQNRCNAWGKCFKVCRFGAISQTFAIDPSRCEGCGFCIRVCPEQALNLQPVTNGEWSISQTRIGPMVHARLGIAEENSGKLVSLIRQKAREIALTEKVA